MIFRKERTDGGFSPEAEGTGRGGGAAGEEVQAWGLARRRRGKAQRGRTRPGFRGPGGAAGAHWCAMQIGGTRSPENGPGRRLRARPPSAAAAAAAIKPAAARLRPAPGE